MSTYLRVDDHSADDIDVVEPTIKPGFCHGLYLHFKQSFKSLSTCPRELYINFFLKFCESYGYFSISQILVIYLHNEFGASDVRAGVVYGIWGACITFWGLTISWLNDNFGVRNSLLLGFSISLISSIILASATSITTIYAVLFCLMPMGTAMGIPMLTVGIKRYTNTTNRGFAFGLYYSVMNIAAFVSGPVVDIFNIGFKSGVTFFGRHWSGNRLVILTTTCTYTASLVVTYFYLREIRVHQLEDEVTQLSSTTATAAHTTSTVSPTQHAGTTNSGNSTADPIDGDIEMSSIVRHRKHTSSPVQQHQRSADTVSVLHSSASSYPIGTIPPHRSAFTIEEDDDDDDEEDEEIVFTQEGVPSIPGTATVSPGENFDHFVPEQKPLSAVWRDLLYSRTFWRFSVLTLFLINLKTIFRHLDATLPTYLIRCFGTSYPKGIIYSINPFIIMWMTPVIAALTTTSPHYDMIKYGGYVSAISPFFMVIATETWAVVLFVVFLSLGEAIWSPRVYDYTMSIAPEGREASFSALAAAPLFAAKVPVGLLSGYLVHTYLPEDGSKPDGQTLWLIVGLLTLTSPILITLFEPCIREPAKTSGTDQAATELSTPSPRSHSADAEGLVEGSSEEHIDGQQQYRHNNVLVDSRETSLATGRHSPPAQYSQRYSALHTAEMSEIEI